MRKTGAVVFAVLLCACSGGAEVDQSQARLSAADGGSPASGDGGGVGPTSGDGGGTTTSDGGVVGPTSGDGGVVGPTSDGGGVGPTSGDGGGITATDGGGNTATDGGGTTTTDGGGITASDGGSQCTPVDICAEQQFECGEHYAGCGQVVRCGACARVDICLSGRCVPRRR